MKKYESDLAQHLRNKYQEYNLVEWKDIIDKIEDWIVENVIEGKVLLTNFGSFEIKTRKGRKIKNPRTGEDMMIPDIKVIKFIASKSVKDIVKQS